MSYELEEIMESQHIFYYLLENKEIREEKERELYKKYVENESIMSLVKSQADISNSLVLRYGNVIYLIPGESNTFLGYSKSELKAELCRSGATDKDYYLSQFVILTLLVEFYEGHGASSKVRDYMKLGELLNSISDRLKEGLEREKLKAEEDNTNKNGLAFSNMFESYEALRSEEKGSRAKTTKEGFLYTILKFLQGQNLIEYIEADDMIQTTDKLDRFMDWNLLNQVNYDRVLKAMGVEGNE